VDPQALPEVLICISASTPLYEEHLKKLIIQTGIICRKARLWIGLEHDGCHCGE
jgi:hypothetical protein